MARSKKSYGDCWFATYCKESVSFETFSKSYQIERGSRCNIRTAARPLKQVLDLHHDHCHDSVVNNCTA